MSLIVGNIGWSYITCFRLLNGNHLILFYNLWFLKLDAFHSQSSIQSFVVFLGQNNRFNGGRFYLILENYF